MKDFLKSVERRVLLTLYPPHLGIFNI